MTFEQKAVIERNKPTNKLGVADRVGRRRELVARYSPYGNGELGVELVSDSDQKAWRKHLKDKESGKQPKKEGGSPAKQLIEPILFPMTTENVQHCKFTVLLATPEMLLLRFEPIGAHDEPIFEGQFFVNGATGAIYRLEIDHLWNFEKINGKFKYLKEFYGAVDYFEQPGGYRFPTQMAGRGYAKVLLVKGDFRFDITESGYALASAEEDPAADESLPASAVAARALDEPLQLDAPAR